MVVVLRRERLSPMCVAPQRGHVDVASQSGVSIAAAPPAPSTPCLPPLPPINAPRNAIPPATEKRTTTAPSVRAHADKPQSASLPPPKPWIAPKVETIVIDRSREAATALAATMANAADILRHTDDIIGALRVHVCSGPCPIESLPEALRGRLIGQQYAAAGSGQSGAGVETGATAAERLAKVLQPTGVLVVDLKRGTVKIRPGVEAIASKVQHYLATTSGNKAVSFGAILQGSSGCLLPQEAAFVRSECGGLARVLSLFHTVLPLTPNRDAVEKVNAFIPPPGIPRGRVLGLGQGGNANRPPRSTEPQPAVEAKARSESGQTWAAARSPSGAAVAAAPPHLEIDGRHYFNSGRSKSAVVESVFAEADDETEQWPRKSNVGPRPDRAALVREALSTFRAAVAAALAATDSDDGPSEWSEVFFLLPRKTMTVPTTSPHGGAADALVDVIHLTLQREWSVGAAAGSGGRDLRVPAFIETVTQEAMRVDAVACRRLLLGQPFARATGAPVWATARCDVVEFGGGNSSRCPPTAFFLLASTAAAMESVSPPTMSAATVDRVHVILGLLWLHRTYPADVCFLGFRWMASYCCPLGADDIQSHNGGLPSDVLSPWYLRLARQGNEAPGRRGQKVDRLSADSWLAAHLASRLQRLTGSPGGNRSLFVSIPRALLLAVRDSLGALVLSHAGRGAIAESALVTDASLQAGKTATPPAGGDSTTVASQPGTSRPPQEQAALARKRTSVVRCDWRQSSVAGRFLVVTCAADVSMPDDLTWGRRGDQSAFDDTENDVGVGIGGASTFEVRLTAPRGGCYVAPHQLPLECGCDAMLFILRAIVTHTQGGTEALSSTSDSASPLVVDDTFAATKVLLAPATAPPRNSHRSVEGTPSSSPSALPSVDDAMYVRVAHLEASLAPPFGEDYDANVWRLLRGDDDDEAGRGLDHVLAYGARRGWLCVQKGRMRRAESVMDGAEARDGLDEDQGDAMRVSAVAITSAGRDQLAGWRGLSAGAPSMSVATLGDGTASAAFPGPFWLSIDDADDSFAVACPARFAVGSSPPLKWAPPV